MQLSCTFEEACTPNMAQWPQCFTKEQNREGSLLHTMEVITHTIRSVFGRYIAEELYTDCRLSSMKVS